MRDLAVLTFITLDGVMQMQAPGMREEDTSGDFGWATSYWSEVMEQVEHEAMSQPFDLLFGRKTYDAFAGYWPNAPESVHRKKLNDATKYVATSRANGLDSENSVQITGEVPAEIAKLKEGESVFVSAASGAVGSVVGQIARIYNCHVAGCAGSDEKLEILTSEFGYDEAFNYKTSESIAASIASVNPDGIDVSFENVGGEIFEATMWNMNNFGRIALCGMIANYNDEKLAPGPRGMMTIIGKRLTISGFIVSDHPKACNVFIGKAAGWIADGKLKYRETIAEGIDNAPAAFIDMLHGRNIGKQIVRLADD